MYLKCLRRDECSGDIWNRYPCLWSSISPGLCAVGLSIPTSFMLAGTIVENRTVSALDSSPLQLHTQLCYHNTYSDNGNLKHGHSIHLQQHIADLRCVRLGYEGLGLACEFIISRQKCMYIYVYAHMKIAGTSDYLQQTNGRPIEDIPLSNKCRWNESSLASMHCGPSTCRLR